MSINLLLATYLSSTSLSPINPVPPPNPAYLDRPAVYALHERRFRLDFGYLVTNDPKNRPNFRDPKHRRSQHYGSNTNRRFMQP